MGASQPKQIGGSMCQKMNIVLTQVEYFSFILVSRDNRLCVRLDINKNVIKYCYEGGLMLEIKPRIGLGEFLINCNFRRVHIIKL